MPADNRELRLLGATLITVGLSAIVKVTPSNYHFADLLKIQSGAGTLEIVNVPATLSGTGATGWGGGYAIGSAEAIAIGGPATFYLAATGATMVAGLLIGLTNANG